MWTNFFNQDSFKLPLAEIGNGKWTVRMSGFRKETMYLHCVPKVRAWFVLLISPREKHIRHKTIWCSWKVILDFYLFFIFLLNEDERMTCFLVAAFAAFSEWCSFRNARRSRWRRGRCGMRAGVDGAGVDGAGADGARVDGAGLPRPLLRRFPVGCRSDGFIEHF